MVIDSTLDFINKLPQCFNLLALDMGEKKIGVALWFSKVATVVPREVIIRRNLKQDLQKVIKLAHEYEISAFVIGLPVDSAGKESAFCDKIRYFAEQLAEASQLNVTFADERYSTAIADDLLKHAGMNRKQRAQHDDALAASIILDNFRQQYFAGSVHV